MAISSQHGGNVLETALTLGVSPHDIIDFSSNINPLGMPESLKHAIIEQMSVAEKYPDVEYRKLHAALAQHHGCPQSWVMAGNGETELIFALINQLNPAKALLLTPGFAEYRRALTRINCDIVDYALDEDDGFQPDARILDALTPDLDCLFLCTPNNPTGLLPDKNLLLAIADRCRALNIALILDEAFLDFVPAETGFIPLLAQYPQLYVLRSLTKFFAIPGLRLGYLVSANTALVTQMKQQREPWTINAFAALAGEIILQDTHYIEATHRWLAQEQPRMFSALAALPRLKVWRPVANYIFMRCTDSQLALQQALLKHHILIRHCANYPGLNANYYRVAIKSPQDNDRLLAALTQILHHG